MKRATRATFRVIAKWDGDSPRAKLVDPEEAQDALDSDARQRAEIRDLRRQIAQLKLAVAAGNDARKVKK